MLGLSGLESTSELDEYDCFLKTVQYKLKAGRIQTQFIGVKSKDARELECAKSRKSLATLKFLSAFECANVVFIVDSSTLPSSCLLWTTLLASVALE